MGHIGHVVERGPSATLATTATASRSVEEERLYRKQRLAATFRLFHYFGFNQGIAGHVSVRDPENPHHYWVNPLAKHFGLMKVSDLQMVDTEGNILVGKEPINQAGFAIHSTIHRLLPDAVAVAHTHSVHGKAFACLGKLLEPLSQDACAFYGDHAIYEHYHGIVLEPGEAERIGGVLGNHKAVILKNHGFLTVGPTIDAAAWWHITMDNAARVQLLAEATGTKTQPLSHEVATLTQTQVGRHEGAIYNFHPLYEYITTKEPDLLD